MLRLMALALSIRTPFTIARRALPTRVVPLASMVELHLALRCRSSLSPTAMAYMATSRLVPTAQPTCRIRGAVDLHLWFWEMSKLQSWFQRPTVRPGVFAPFLRRSLVTPPSPGATMILPSDGTIYLGYQSLDGHPRIAASHDKGLNWSTPYDVGAQVVNGSPVVNTTFPAVVAGDGNRATFAFYGSETGGDNYHCGQGDDCSDTTGQNPKPAFTGVWYL